MKVTVVKKEQVFGGADVPSAWRRCGARSPRAQKSCKSLVGAEEHSNLSIVPPPHYNIPQNCNLALSTSTLVFIPHPASYGRNFFFIASYYCTLNFKCSAANFRCLRDLRWVVPKCFIEHKCKFATCWEGRDGLWSFQWVSFIVNLVRM